MARAPTTLTTTAHIVAALAAALGFGTTRSLTATPAPAATPAPPQESSAPRLDSSTAGDLPGLYELEDGRLIEVFDVVDQTRFPQLVAIEPESGRVRTLYPLSAPDTASDTVTLSAGAAWFVPEPSSYRLRFIRSGGTATGVVMEEGGRSIPGRRVDLPVRPVTFRNGDVTLAGEIVLPRSPGPHAAVVIVHGSGPLTRRGPRYMAHLLAAGGVAALIYDKRGTGESSGAWRGASYADLADDAEAALDRLLAEPDVDPERVGLFGSSEAGYIVPVVAARRPEVSLLVCRVCPALAQRYVAPVQQRNALSHQGFSGRDLEEALAFHMSLVDYAVDRTGHDELRAAFDRHRDARWMERYGFAGVPPPEAGYWDRFEAGLTLDPGRYYERLRIPTLVVLGERDARIAVDQHAEAFRDHARRAGNTDFTVEIMPGADHGLMEVRYDDDGEELPAERYSPGFHSMVVRWIGERFGVADGGARATCTDGVELTYLANAAVLLRGDAAGVLIDAPFTTGVAPYPRLRPGTLEAIRAAEPPFDGIDWILVTHAHADHFDAAAVARHLESNPRARAVGPPEVVARIRSASRDRSIAGRLVVAEPDEDAPSSVHEENPRIEALALHHGRGREVANVGYRVTVDGVSFLHPGDAEVTATEFRRLGLAVRRVDAALLPTWYFVGERFRPALAEIPSSVRFVIHLPSLDYRGGFVRRFGGWPGLREHFAGFEPAPLPLTERGSVHCVGPNDRRPRR